GPRSGRRPAAGCCSSGSSRGARRRGSSRRSAPRRLPQGPARRGRGRRRTRPDARRGMLVVTGGGGFIGSVLAAKLNEAGHADLVIVDHFGSGDKWRNIAKREFAEILPIDGLLPWLERFGGEVEAVF